MKLKLRVLTLLAILVLYSLRLAIQSYAVQAGTTEAYVYKSTVVYTNQGENPQDMSLNLRTLNIFLNSSWQTVYLLNANRPYALGYDTDANPTITIDTPPVARGENVTLILFLVILPQDRKPPMINVEGAGSLDDIPGDLRKGLLTTMGSWQVEDPDLQRLAHRIWRDTGNTSNALRVVTALADWIGRSVSVKDSEVPRYPKEVYTALSGDCDDQANLLITMGRILGIPAYLQVGAIWNGKESEETETYWDGHVTSVLRNVDFHGWAVMYIPPWGWLPFDMTLGWSSSNQIAGITSAAVWNVGVAHILNVMTSDWAGDSRRMRGEIVESPLHVRSESEMVKTVWKVLTRDDTGTHLYWIVPSAIVAAILVPAVFYYFKRGRGGSP